MNGAASLAFAVLVAALTVIGAAGPATSRHERVVVLNRAEAAGTTAINCDAGERIQPAVDAARPGDTIVVSGLCAEHLVIRSEVTRITLDGQGSATILGPVATEYVVYVAGKEITIAGFTITGGLDGIHLAGAAGGASAIVDGNTIEKASRRGIFMDQTSVVRIANSTIQDNLEDGVYIVENSSARIGLITASQQSSNTIRNNGGHGISVLGSSNALIMGNSIEGNSGDGIRVARNAQANVGRNLISDNGGDGIGVSLGAGVTLPGQQPNLTDSSRINRGFGVQCSVGGYIEGSLGTLDGARGSKHFDIGCIDYLNP